MNAIWEDYFVDLKSYSVSGKPVDYVIYDQGDGLPIYNGRAYLAPDGSMKVRVNDVCAAYLGHISLQGLMALGTTSTLDEYSGKEFSLFVNGVETEVDNWTFVNCWTYRDESGYIYASKQISNEMLPTSEMPLYFIATQSDNGISYRNNMQIGTEVIVECCNPAILYFINAHGAWDWLLCKGGARKSVSYNRNTIQRQYNNSTHARGVDNYRNEEVVKYTCHTGWIPGKGGQNIGQLLGSPDVWLWTPDEGFQPVIISTNSARAVDYKGNGYKPVEYAIEVELAQDRERR